MSAAATPDPGDAAGRGLVEAVLRELAEHLARLALDAQATAAIDLRSLPLADADRAALRARLGAGEVRATLPLAGSSHVEETGYAGVWWVRHDGAGGDVLAEHLVVARVPELLLAHPDDVADAARRLGTELAAAAPSAVIVEDADA